MVGAADDARRGGGGTIDERRGGAANDARLTLVISANNGGGGGSGASPGGGEPRSEAAFQRGFSSVPVDGFLASTVGRVEMCGVGVACIRLQDGALPRELWKSRQGFACPPPATRLMRAPVFRHLVGASALIDEIYTYVPVHSRPPKISTPGCSSWAGSWWRPKNFLALKREDLARALRAALRARSASRMIWGFISVWGLNMGLND